MSSNVKQSKISSKYQITIPKEIRKLLNLKAGDTVCFVVNNGNITLCCSPFAEMVKIQNEMSKEAQKLGIKNDQDVQNLIKELRN